MEETINPNDILTKAETLRGTLSSGFRDEIVKSLYAEAETIARRAVKTAKEKKYDLDQQIDRLVTSPIFGFPIMLLLLGLVFWLTITGANIPSQMIANVLFWIEDKAAALFTSWGIPWWITGFIWHGTYRGLAWVVSVMLPPMAIFFPMFTILEDLGYLPRVAFNLDWLFKKAGAHGKQSLTMAMGFGCNAAGVIATRVMDSPRERLIAILTNNFVPCNGRFPTLILLATVFVAASFSPAFDLLLGGRISCRRGIDRRFLHPAGFVDAFQDHSQGRSLCLHLGTASLPSPQDWANSVHIPDRSHQLCVVARHLNRRPCWCSDLDSRQYLRQRDQSRTAYGQLSKSVWLVVGIGWGDPVGLHHRHSRQRDRCTNHDDDVHGRWHDDGHPRFDRTAHTAGWSTQLDHVNGGQPYVVQFAAQPVCYDHSHDLQGNKVVEMGDAQRGHYARYRVPRYVYNREPSQIVRVGIISTVRKDFGCPKSF